MANDRQNARQQIEKLVQFFDSNIYQFKSSSFNETQARNQLIDPLFEAFGWDVHNRDMKPLYLQEVVPEGRVKTNIGKESEGQEKLFKDKDTYSDKYKEYSSILEYIAEDEYKVRSKEANKKPDYRFRIKGQTKFFVEAKKPFVDLSKNQEAIFQVKRYGFSGRVPVSILTDFEEFRVFDCTSRPQFDKPKLGVLKEYDLVYKQYIDNFERMYDTFSRDAVEAGSLETLTKKLLQKRTGDFALDKEFLEDLSKWREELARDIAKHPRNRKRLNDYTLNESVQRILDRIVFIRVCEDREIEVENTLLAILRIWHGRQGVSLYSLLNDLFKQRRSLYNGLLFAQHSCEELEINNEVLVKILQNLNYPFSPYHFNEIGVEILGSIYEKFLGKTIHLAPKNVIVKEKPEVRKAGGVYYTPQYIVKYIVDNTLGKLLYGEESHPELGSGSKEQMPKQVRHDKTLKLSPKQAAKLKIIDIACGSGSFLLGAFQKLIDYHIEWFTAHPEDIKTENNVPDAYKDVNGNLHLSPRMKRDILVNNIYGVDIDRQAVEVTQMSLYLKVLEGENADTLNPQMTLALKEVYLPSMEKNIKCGNSLIGTDFTSQGDMFDSDTRQKVNPFDWEMEFPEILGSKANLSVSTEKINPPSFGLPPFNEGERMTTNPQSGITKATQTFDMQGGFDVVIGNPPYVFGRDWKSLGISEEQKLYLGSKFKSSPYQLDMFSIFMEQAFRLSKLSGRIGQIVPNVWLTNTYSSTTRAFVLSQVEDLILAVPPSDVFQGITVDTVVYTYRKVLKEGNNFFIGKIDTNEYTEKAKYTTKQYVDGSRPISTTLNTELAEFLYRIKDRFTELDEIADVTRGVHPYRTGGYGKSFYSNGQQIQRDVDERPYHSNKMKKGYRPFIYGKDLKRFTPPEEEEYVLYGDWLAEPRNPRYFEGERVYSRKILGDHLVVTLEKINSVADQQVYVTKPKATDYRAAYLAGILGSRFIAFFVRQYFGEVNDAFPQIKVGQLQSLPIRTIDFTKPAEKKIHDSLVALVEKMLELNKQLQKASFDSEKEPIERQIAATDKKIDELVYQLYDLTEEEIAIVEGKTI